METFHKLGTKISALFKSVQGRKNQICPICGNVNPQKSRFCDFCGNPLPLSPATSAAATSAPDIITSYVSDNAGTEKSENSLVVLEISSMYESEPYKRVLSVMVRGVERIIKAKEVAEKFAPNLLLKKSEETNWNTLMSDFLSEAYELVSQRVSEPNMWANAGLLASIVDGRQLLAACIGNVSAFIIGKDRISLLGGCVSKAELKLHTESLKNGDYVVLCDGLTNYLKNKEIQNIIAEVKKPQRVCEKLMSLAKERGAKTGLSIAVFQII